MWFLVYFLGVNDSNKDTKCLVQNKKVKLRISFMYLLHFKSNVFLAVSPFTKLCLIENIIR